MLERNWRVENHHGQREEILLSQKLIHMERSNVLRIARGAY